jgi:hypothetical protein
MLFEHAIGTPYLPPESWHERWDGLDKGVIFSWARGIEMSGENPKLALKAQAGELPVLAWKGGIGNPIKSKTKVGSLLYLATWQGLRGEDLCIDDQVEVQMTCTRTGVPITFTGQLHKLLLIDESDDE